MFPTAQTIKIVKMLLMRTDKLTKLYFYFQYVPVRWLPHEAVLEDDFSTKSDVWSYGCLIWEVIHQAAIPLSHISNEKVVEALERKEILWDSAEIQKLAIPQRLRQLLSQCWDANPKNRPSFSSLVITLSEISKESSTVVKVKEYGDGGTY